MQHSTIVIVIRPFKGGWQCYEGFGGEPYWTGETAKKCNQLRQSEGKFGRGQIRVLNADGSTEQVIPFYS